MRTVYSFTIKRANSLDPLEVIHDATRQAQAESLVRELRNPDNTDSLSFYYNLDGTDFDLMVQGTEEAPVRHVASLMNTRYGQPEPKVEEVTHVGSDKEEPPDLLEITDTEDGCPADDDRARQVMDYFGYTGPLEPGSRPGLYRVSLPASVLREDTAMLDDGDWHVEVVQRDKVAHDASAATQPYANGREAVLMDSGWLVREHPRPCFAAEADSPPEEGAFSLVVYPDGAITYFDWRTTYSHGGHVDDPLLPHQLAESVQLHVEQTDP